MCWIRSSRANSEEKSTDGKKDKLDLHLYKDQMIEETVLSLFFA